MNTPAALSIVIVVVAAIATLIYLIDRRSRADGGLFLRPPSKAMRIFGFLLTMIFVLISVYEVVSGEPLDPVFPIFAAAVLAFSLGAGDILRPFEQRTRRMADLAITGESIWPARRVLHLLLILLAGAVGIGAVFFGCLWLLGRTGAGLPFLILLAADILILIGMGLLMRLGVGKRDAAREITVRDAAETDRPALEAIKGPGSAARHRDRLREARGADFRYLVVLAEREVIGFACLVSRPPPSWPDVEEDGYLPKIVDLEIEAARRGQGYGTAFMHTMEDIAATAGFDHLYLSVDPVSNERAYALYQRLGYRALQAEPYRKAWEFTDSAGNIHRGDDWVVDMVKKIKEE